MFRELSIRGNLSAKECLKVLYPKAAAGKSLNFKDIDGNTTQKRLYEAYSKILSNKGYGDYDFSQMRAEDTLKVVHDAFSELGYNTDFLSLDSSSGNLESQTLYKIWHLLYSFEGDKSVSGIDNLVRKLQEITLMDENSARLLASFTKLIRIRLKISRESFKYALTADVPSSRTHSSLINSSLITTLRLRFTCTAR